MVYVDEDGAAELDGYGGIRPGVDGGGAASDIRRALEDGDVGWCRGGCGVLSEMVGC